MNYMRALGLIGYVSQALAIIATYQQHKSIARLASQLSATLLQALQANGLAKDLDPLQTHQITEAVAAVVSLTKGK